MNKADSQKLIWKYTIRGLILGLFFPVILLIIEGLNFNTPFSFTAIFKLIFSNPLYLFTFLVPIVIPVFTYFFGRAFTTKIDLYKNAFLTEIKKSEKITDFIQKLKNEEIDAEYEILNDDDILGKSLIDLRNTLKKNKEIESQRRKEDEQRAWVSEGLAKFGEILRMDNDNIEELSYNIIKNLANYTEANQGGFYILQNNNKNKEDYLGCGRIVKNRLLNYVPKERRV